MNMTAERPQRLLNHIGAGFHQLSVVRETAKNIRVQIDNMTDLEMIDFLRTLKDSTFVDDQPVNRDLYEALDRLLLAVENDQLLPASSALVKDAKAALANHL